MAWGRVLNVYVGSSRTNDKEFLQVCGGAESVHVKAEVKRSNRMKENKAHVTIYNLNAEHRAIIETVNGGLRIEAGYQDEGVGVIFNGQVIMAESHRDGTDWVTEIHGTLMRTNNLTMVSQPISVGYSAGTSMKVVMKDIAEYLGVVLIGGANCDLPLPSGLVISGTVGDLFHGIEKHLRASGVAFHYDISELVCYKIGKAVSEFEAVYLDFDSGLLHANPVVDPAKDEYANDKSENRLLRARARLAQSHTPTKKGKVRSAQTVLNAQKAVGAAAASATEQARMRGVFKALVHPHIRPNCLIQFGECALKGWWICDDIVFKLSNFGGDFGVQGAVSHE